MTIDEQIAVLQAVKEGRKIEAQLLSRTNSGWDEWHGMLDFINYRYRIVREPRRFIIFKLGTFVYAQPYGEQVPLNGKIICTAVEEENIGAAALAKLGTEIAE